MLIQAKRLPNPNMYFNLDNNNNSKSLLKISFSKLTVFYTAQNYTLNVLYEVL